MDHPVCQSNGESRFQAGSNLIHMSQKLVESETSNLLELISAFGTLLSTIFRIESLERFGSSRRSVEPRHNDKANQKVSSQYHCTDAVKCRARLR